MTTLHMDTGALRAVQRGLHEVQSQIERRVSSLRQSNQYLHDNWVANSANEYLYEFSTIETRLEKIAQQLGEVSAELSVEIARWESMDKTF